MAQLPPKAPNMTTHNWPAFPHQRMSFISNHLTNAAATAATTTPTTSTNTAATAMTINNSNNQQQQPSWVDEFLDFSSVRRGAHRRSISDSIAFLDPPSLVDDCRNNICNSMNNNNMPEANCAFDRLDDEQLMSMFSDDISVAVPLTASSSNPSTPSDQNSNNDEKTTLLDQQVQQPKNEPGEVDSSCKNESQASHPAPASNGDTVIDPKRVKRILANRQSAQRSRVRKLQYISELERSVTTLQTEVSALSPRVAFLDHQRLILNVDNSALKQRIAALAQDKIFKDAHQEALKKEIERLRQVYHHQNLKKMNNNDNNNAAPPLASVAGPPQQPPMNTDAMGCTDKDQQRLS